VHDVSVVLPTRNNQDHIDGLLSNILSQEFNGEIEVLILDSSNDHTPEIALRWGNGCNVRVVRVEPRDYNYGGTRNLGARMSTNEFLVLLSTDVDIRRSDWLKTLLRSFSDPTVAGVYGRQSPKEDASPMEHYFINYTYPQTRKEYCLGSCGEIRDLFFSNTNSAIRREVWEKIPLPEMLKSEDQEWAKRVILRGYKIIYDPEAVVYHSHHYTLKQVFKDYFDSGATLPYVYNDSRIVMENFLTRGLKFEHNEIKYFIKNGYAKSLPYTFAYDTFKFLGYFLGTKCKHMPVWLRKAFCKKSNHWDKYDDIIKKNEVDN
jgi:rhamnosyltransferase